MCAKRRSAPWREGKTRYTNVDGIPELKAAVARKFKRDNGIDAKPERDHGLVGRQADHLQRTAGDAQRRRRGDHPRALLGELPEIVRLCDATPVFAVADASTGFKLSPEALEAAITPRTKWLILNTPSNPTGAAYSAAELKALTDVLLRHPHVHILTDDIYEVLVCDGGKFATVAQVEPSLQPRTLTMNGVSKSHADDRLSASAIARGRRSSSAAMTKLRGSRPPIHRRSRNGPPSKHSTDRRSSSPAGARRFQERRDLVVNGLNANTGLAVPHARGRVLRLPLGRPTCLGKYQQGRRQARRPTRISSWRCSRKPA